MAAVIISSASNFFMISSFLSVLEWRHADLWMAARSKRIIDSEKWHASDVASIYNRYKGFPSDISIYASRLNDYPGDSYFFAITW
ncbi:hypothetical protein ACU4GD_44070 [Cupriavidus basilensis]